MGEEYNVSPEVVELPVSRTFGIDWRSRPDQLKDAYKHDGVINLIRGEEAPSVVFLGSSHGLMWGPVIASICKELSVSSAFYLADGTIPLITLPLEAKPLGGVQCC